VAAASIDEKLYLFGGRGGDSRPRNSFHILDLNTGHFTLFRTTNTPKGREGHSMSAYKNLLIIYGGCESGGNENDPFEDIWVVDIETRTWSKPNTTGRRPEAREGHAAGVIRNFMLIYGGSGTKSLLANMFSFNLTTFEWKELEQQGHSMGPRESMGATVVGDNMFLFGGNVNDKQDESDEYTDDLFMISLKNNTAHVKKLIPASPIPPKRLSHSLSNLNNKYLILFGGESFGQALNDIWVFDIDKNIWHEIKPQNSISARMAHVCYCYKDSVFVFGGMAQDQVVKSDLAILKFGKCEINVNNGSGVNPKRKFTKLINVTARTVPTVAGGFKESLSSFCEKCGHASGVCKFCERFNDMAFPLFSFFPRIQLATSAVEALASQFQDPFAAVLRIAEVLQTSCVAFSIAGSVNMKGNNITKNMQNDNQREFTGKGENENDQKNHKSIQQVPILEISSKIELSPEKLANLCTGVSNQSLIPSFFCLSETSVIISRTSEHLTVALLHKQDFRISLYLAVFDNNQEALYPSKDLVGPTMVNVYSRSHLQSIDVLRHPKGTSVFLYPKEIDSALGDLLFQGNSFSALVSMMKGVHYIVGGSLVKKEKMEKENISGKFKVFKYSGGPFALLVYVKKKLAYWEFRKNDKSKRNRDDCLIIKLDQVELLSNVTGLLKLSSQTMEIFAEVFGSSKKRCLE
jgi:N-acetylneuraminic acid mutarotase